MRRRRKPELSAQCQTVTARAQLLVCPVVANRTSNGLARNRMVVCEMACHATEGSAVQPAAVAGQ